MKHRVIHTNLTFPKVMLCLILLGICTVASAAQMYKWVDENGQIRYADRLPPSQVKLEHHTLNAQGVIVSTRKAAKTEEEIKALKDAEKLLQAKQEIEKRKQEAQGNLDRVLLLTFSSEKELSRARDDRIDVLDSVIRLIYKGIASTQDRLSRLEGDAKRQYTSKGREVPGGLAQNIEESIRKIDNREKQLQVKLEEKYKIQGQFEIDVARFRLLHSK
jgi:hypothetical protein